MCFFFSSRRRHTRSDRDWSSDVCSSDLGSKEQNGAIAVLDIGRMHNGVKQEPYRIDKDVTLLAVDLLARVVARRIDADPPFSAPFTL